MLCHLWVLSCYECDPANTNHIYDELYFAKAPDIEFTKEKLIMFSVKQIYSEMVPVTQCDSSDNATSFLASCGPV